MAKIHLGAKIQDPGGHWWTVAAIGWDGESYYMMTDKHGVVSKMPSATVEAWFRTDAEE